MDAAGSFASFAATLACALSAWLAPSAGIAQTAWPPDAPRVAVASGPPRTPGLARTPAAVTDAPGAATAGALAASPPAATRYRLDPRHSGVTFRVDNFWHAHLTMRFARMRAELSDVGDDRLASRVDVTVDAASLGANVPFVAALVKGSAMLDVARYPEIRFVGTRFERTGATTGVLTGELTIRAMTRPITLAVRFDAGRQLEPDTGARAEREGDESDESGESNPAERRAGQGVADSRDAMRRETDSGSAHRGAEPPERIARAAPDAARPLAFVADGHFSRTAFGLSRWLPAVGDDVRLRIRAEFVRTRADP
ncbi:YceI family protein [Burkholderia pseudomallei]|uniref:YceI family protein n=1 Tax=Burkholderia pseudomallei TaxID=28450 RepID=UPI0029323DAE|nr:YceI family protein [Burkholderia pseudomallei]MDV2205762.1 YceI family protein [Burkholderia pseudomallei]